jgi:hypothetical protein
MTPLTCVTGTANVRGVKLDGQPTPFETRGDTVVINLPHANEQALPRRIGHVDVPPAVQALGDEQQCADFPGLKGLLVADPARQKLSLTLAAPADGELRNVHVRFRLPLQYEPGIVTHALDRVKPDTPQTVDIALPAPRPEPFWAEGPQYWVAEIDFTGPTGPGRLFVTRLMP